MIRLRKRRRLARGRPEGPALPAELFVRTLSVGQRHLLEGRFLGSVAVDVVGLRRTDEEYVILATTLAPEQALALYRRRWEIETLFAGRRAGLTWRRRTCGIRSGWPR